MTGQTLLFEDLNPLLKRLGPAFFKTAPRQPGIYLMRSRGGEILYVGKAKCLRNRLNSYKNARAAVVSRKVVRLLRLTHSIETRVCESETAALLLENQLLRELRPPFNVVNTAPETYYFIVVRVVSRRAGRNAATSRVSFQLTTEPEEEDESGGRRFGVFKGRGRTRDSFGALLRLISALAAGDERFYFAPALVRHRPPYQYELDLPDELLPLLYAFLHGRARSFLDRLAWRLLSNEFIPRFIHHVIETDLKTLDDFYEHGPRRVAALKKAHAIRRRPIAQDEIDDLLVLVRPGHSGGAGK